MDIRKNIIGIVKELLEDDTVEECLSQNDDLTQFNLNSISFIKLIVAIENQYCIEFDDEALDYSKFLTLTSICEYVEKCIQEQN